MLSPCSLCDAWRVVWTIVPMTSDTEEETVTLGKRQASGSGAGQALEFV